MKKILKFLPLASVIVPTIMISCQQKEPLTPENSSANIKTFEFKGLPKMYELDKVGSIFDNKTIVEDLNGKEHEITLWDYFHAVEGEITHLADGDTVTIKVTKQPKKLPFEETPVVVNEVMSLRISNIDTLEENTNKVSDRERSLAEMDHKFADSLLLGQKVRVISENWSKQSYNRFVANVFYGENFNRNFGVDMLANGYTLARMETIDFNIFSSKYKTNRLISDPDIRSLLMPYLAFAINYGYQAKKGFYGDPVNLASPLALSREYAEHDKDMINNSDMILRPEYLPYPNLAKPSNNIYKFFEKIKK